MRHSNFSSRLASLLADESGSAVIELLGFGVLLQVPILVIAGQLLVVQHNQLAAQSLARQLVRVMLQSENAREADARANLMLTDAVGNFRIDRAQLDFAVDCEPACWQPGVITVTVTLDSVTETAKGIRQ